MNISDTLSTSNAGVASEDMSVLGKDDFMKLLLTELQYQDPTDPMDSDKILQQTSQLATLESAQNTQDALEELTSSMKNNNDFSTISAIGKMADLGSGEIALGEGGTSNFEIYFPDDISSGNIYIKDVDDNTIKTVGLSEQDGGTLSFSWDGTDDSGNRVGSGSYYVESQYSNSAGETKYTRVGTYPISSVKFDEGKTYLRLGSSYVEMSNIKEVY